jgi:hypothetical protein
MKSALRIFSFFASNQGFGSFEFSQRARSRSRARLADSTEPRARAEPSWQIKPSQEPEPSQAG